MKKYAFVCLLILLCGMLGCSDSSNKVAEINGKAITQADFDLYLKTKNINTKDTKRVGQSLEQFLAGEALLAAINKEDFPGRDLMEARANEYRKEMLIKYYFDEFLKTKISNQAIKDYYDAHIEEFKTRNAHVAQILVRTDRKMSNSEKEAKKAKAQEYYVMTTGGKDFGEIAKEFSDDRLSSKKGGDLGWIMSGAFDPVFTEKVFAMEAGAVSEPFETRYGFHIVKMIEPIQEKIKPLKSAEREIRRKLNVEVKQAETERLLAKMKIKKMNK